MKTKVDKMVEEKAKEIFHHWGLPLIFRESKKLAIYHLIDLTNAQLAILRDYLPGSGTYGNIPSKTENRYNKLKNELGELIDMQECNG